MHRYKADNNVNNTKKKKLKKSFFFYSGWVYISELQHLLHGVMCARTKIDEVCHSVVAQLDRPAAVWSNHAIYQTSQPEPCDIIARVHSELLAASIARSPLRRAVSELFILPSAQDRKRGRRWVV